MLNFSAIIRKAYTMTIRHPLLWVFGLFVIGGFNLNFLHFEGLGNFNVHSNQQVWGLLVFLQQNPRTLALVSASVLVVSVGGLIVTNGSRILLTLSIKNLLENNFLEFSKIIAPARQVFLPVVKMSLLTTTFMMAVSMVLLIPPLFFVREPTLQLPLYVLGGLLLLPLTFAISCLNIFTALFIILFRQPLGKAFSQAADFFIAHWTQLLGFILVLLVIYCGTFVVGASFILGIRYVTNELVKNASGLGIPQISAIILVTRTVTSLCIWLLLAGLNVFFNISLVLVFLELVKPQKATPESAPAVTPMPTPV